VSDLSAPSALYLRRLGLGLDLPPTLETLVRIHRQHLETVPYENLGIMLGRPPSVLPAACLDRVGAVGRAGYCFHQNGALELVLRDLGFAVSRRHGHVWSDEANRSDTTLNHLVLVVDGLPTADNPGGRWWPDVGLGDALRDPLPVVVGSYGQGPFSYEITEVREDGWSFRHDPRGSFSGIEITTLPIDQATVEAAHARLSTPPGGDFTRLLVAQRRSESGADTFRGCLLTHVDGSGTTQTELATYDDWRSALVERVRLPLGDVDQDELRALYDRQWTGHVAWTAAGRP
jgi:arylamine N-acetyltransferase